MTNASESASSIIVIDTHLKVIVAQLLGTLAFSARHWFGVLRILICVLGRVLRGREGTVKSVLEALFQGGEAFIEHTRVVRKLLNALSVPLQGLVKREHVLHHHLDLCLRVRHARFVRLDGGGQPLDIGAQFRKVVPDTLRRE